MKRMKQFMAKIEIKFMTIIKTNNSLLLPKSDEND